MINKNISFSIVSLIAIATIVLLAMHGPIHQPLAYYNFADNRTMFGIPDFWNVFSNIGFLIAGIIGIYFLFSKYIQVGKQFVHEKERYAYIIFFTGSLLISFGSSYFHWNPNSQTLVWDRLTMTISFMAFFAAMISERINYKLGLYLLAPLVVLGVASVIYWHYTGDLRPYVFVQFFPLLALPLLLILFPARYTGVWYLMVAFILYLLAKIFEMYDKPIFMSLHGVISGHTLKHFIAAIAIFFIFLYVYFRRIK